MKVKIESGPPLEGSFYIDKMYFANPRGLRLVFKHPRDEYTVIQLKYDDLFDKDISIDMNDLLTFKIVQPYRSMSVDGYIYVQEAECEITKIERTETITRQVVIYDRSNHD
jgi:hypothetical protein